MKKSIVLILAVLLIGSLVFADNSEKKTVTVDDQITTLKDSIRKLNVQNYKSDADELNKKADYEADKGHDKLAEAYRKCADANLKIASGYEQGKQKMIDAANEELFLSNRYLKKVKNEFSKQMNSIKAKFDGIVDKYENLTKEYETKAKEAHDAGNKDLFLIYSECTEAQKEITEGVQKTIDGRCRYMKAVKEYNLFVTKKKLTLPKILIPKGEKETKEFINSLMEESQDYANKSAHSLKSSNAQLTLAYNQISEAKQSEAAGLSKILSGRNDLSRAQKKLEKYFQKHPKARDDIK